jgi:hypothetical protein
MIKTSGFNIPADYLRIGLIAEAGPAFRSDALIPLTRQALRLVRRRSRGIRGLEDVRGRRLPVYAEKIAGSKKHNENEDDDRKNVDETLVHDSLP